MAGVQALSRHHFKGGKAAPEMTRRRESSSLAGHAVLGGSLGSLASEQRDLAGEKKGDGPRSASFQMAPQLSQSKGVLRAKLSDHSTCPQEVCKLWTLQADAFLAFDAYSQHMPVPEAGRPVGCPGVNRLCSGLAQEKSV